MGFQYDVKAKTMTSTAATGIGQDKLAAAIRGKGHLVALVFDRGELPLAKHPLVGVVGRERPLAGLGDTYWDDLVFAAVDSSENSGR